MITNIDANIDSREAFPNHHEDMEELDAFLDDLGEFYPEPRDFKFRGVIRHVDDGTVFDPEWDKLPMNDDASSLSGSSSWRKGVHN